MRLARHTLGQLAVVGTLLLSSGCSILPQAEPTDVYRLSTAQPAASASHATPEAWSLRIVRPRTSEMLDSPRIAVVPQGDMISNYKGARWTDPAPVALRNRLLDAFYRDGRVQSLSTDDSNLQADFELSGELQSFQSEYHGTAIDVVIRLDARLANDRQRIVASHRFEVHQPIADKQIASVVTGFNQASDTLSAQLLQWTVEQGRQHYETLPKNQ